MSKQLALSIALSVLAMTAFAVFGTDGADAFGSGPSLHLPISAQAPALPTLSQLFPALQ
jgi:hypothetical protein